MALSHATIRVLARMLRDREGIGGTALTFGVQKISGTTADLRGLLEAERFVPRADPGDRPSPDSRPGKPRVLQDALFSQLGYTTTESIDVVDKESPTYVLDLNRPVPEDLHGRYDLVVDGGTTEHCFDPPQVFANAARLLKVGGHVVHATPIAGWVMHGFYQLSPNVVFQYYAENGFGEIDARIVFGGRCLDPLEYMPRRGFGSQRALLVFVARKQQDVAQPKPPVQFQPANPESARLLGALNRTGNRKNVDGARLSALWMPHRWASDAYRALREWAAISRHSKRI